MSERGPWNLERVGVIVMVVLTVVIAIFTYQVTQISNQAFKKEPIEIAIAGIYPNSHVRGLIPVTCSITGGPYDTFTSLVFSVSEGTSCGLLFDDQHTFQLDTLDLEDGEYILRVEVFHKSETIKRLQVEFFIDNTPPNIEIAELSENQVIGHRVHFGVLFPGESEEIEYDVLLDNSAISTEYLDTNLIEDGYHTLSVSVTDLAGNVGITSLEFIVDTSEPQIRSLGLNDDDPVRARRTIEPDIQEPNISEVKWYVDERLFCEQIAAEWDTTTLSDGNHSIRLWVKDAVGLTTQKTATVLVDNTPPVLDSMLREVSLLPLNTASPYWVSVSAEDVCDAEVTLQYYVNGELYPSSKINLAHFEKESKVVNVKVVALDDAGNEASFENTILIERTPRSFLNHFKLRILNSLDIAFKMIRDILSTDIGFVINWGVVDSGEFFIGVSFCIGMFSPFSAYMTYVSEINSTYPTEPFPTYPTEPTEWQRRVVARTAFAPTLWHDNSEEELSSEWPVFGIITGYRESYVSGITETTTIAGISAGYHYRLSSDFKVGLDVAVLGENGSRAFLEVSLSIGSLFFTPF